MSRLKRRSPEQVVMVAAGLGALALVLRILTAASDLGVRDVILTFALSTGWGASAAAAGLLALAAIARARQGSAATPSAGYTLVAAAALGVAWLVSGTTIVSLGRVGDGTLMALAGAAALIVASWFHRRVPPRSWPRVLLLIAIAIGFHLPREAGTYAVRSGSIETRHSWTSDGNENCQGIELGDRPSGIAPYQPDYVVHAHLSGNLGELVRERFEAPGGELVPVEDRALVRVRGDWEYGGFACHLPLFKSLHVTSRASVEVRFNRDFDEGLESRLQCNATHQLRMSIDVQARGIASCRDLAREAADAIAEQIHDHARSVCGH